MLRVPVPVGFLDKQGLLFRAEAIRSFVDDLGQSRGVVLSRAATILRSIETRPLSRLADLSAQDGQPSRRGCLFGGDSLRLF